MPGPLPDVTDCLACGVELTEPETEQEIACYFGVNESDLDMENYCYENETFNG